MSLKIVLVLLSMALLLSGRENPFFPAKDVESPTYTTNKVVKNPPFRSQSFQLPSSARILKSVTIVYENIDGSIAKKDVPIDKTIDWHKKLVLQYKENKNQKGKKQYYKKVASLRFISFYVSGQNLKIITKDKLLRNFKLVKPDRIALDFQRDADFRTYTFKAKGAFKKITLGNHEHYYRVVIELDGRYIYKVKKIDKGYKLELH